MEPHLQYTLNLLARLVNIPSPSGNTKRVMQFIQAEADKLGLSYQFTNKGALLITVPGLYNSAHRLLTAHVDTLGAMVKEIKPSGRLKLAQIGGFSFQSIEGEYCEVETSSGLVFSGTILSTNASVHVYKEARTLERNENTIEVRLDEEVHSAEDTRTLGIGVGDFVSFSPRCQITPSGFIKSRHLDDKASVACLFGVLHYLHEHKLLLPFTTHFLISNNEEIGYGGNSNIPAQTVEYLAVDMGAIGEGQMTDEYSVSICAKDASGPYHYALRKHLVALASLHRIEYRVDLYPYYNSDASAALKAGADVKHGLIGPGIDASHATERTHHKALDNTIKLILAYLQSELAKEE